MCYSHLEHLQRCIAVEVHTCTSIASGPTIPLQSIAYIHKWALYPSTMDARDYDRIADLLMQIRGKIANNLQTTTTKGKWTKEVYLDRINKLLDDTDMLAHHDLKGLL